MTDNRNGAFDAISFWKIKLDEIRLNNFILDKLLVLCYTIYTIKRKEVIKMATDYKSFTNEELSKQIEEMKAELQRRENLEKERRWTEVRNILYNWFRDYGDIDINFGELYLNNNANYSCFGEIITT